MVEVLGKAAHSGSEPEKGINSISAAAKMINGIKLGQVDSKTTANIGVISGGTKANIVPAKTTFTLELRGHDLYRFNSLKNKYLDHFKNIAKEYKAKIIIRERKILNGYSFLEEDQALVFFKKACAKTGVKYSPSLTMGGSDANIFNMGRMDTLDISVGIWNAHSGQEYIKLSDMEKSVKLILNYLDIVNKV